MSELSLIPQLVIILLLSAYAYILFKSHLDGKVLRRSALIIFVLATALHVYGYTYEYYIMSPLSSVLRAAFFSFKLFLYEDSFLDVPKVQEAIPLFTDLYLLIFYAAMLTSISAIIMLFAKRVVTFFSLYFRKNKFDHVFIGMNRRTEMIVKDLKDKEVAIIEFPSDDDNQEISVSSLLKGLSQDSGSNSAFAARHITVLKAKRNLAYVEGGTDAFGLIGLSRMKKFIGKNTAFYILSENSEKNLKDLMALMNDNSIRHNTVHTSISREGVAQSYKLVLGKTGAHFIYPSSMSVVELMRSPEYHPASLMNIDTDADGNPTGTVSGEFNALVVGFGETGQAATKFIYEFSSAIRRDGSDLPVKIYVNDHKLERPQGQFTFACPDMVREGIIQYDNSGLDSGHFWTSLLEKLDRLNYIVISMQDDTANLDLACTIFAYVQKKRKNGFENLRILVRKRNTPNYERKLIERLNDKAGFEFIVCFGELSKIFTASMIVSKSSSGINSNATVIADRLKDQFTRISGQSLTDVDKSGSYHQFKTGRMTMHQFISSANHIPSKMKMSGAVLSESLIDNISRCEHLRYKRYLLAHGYSFDIEDDDVLLTNHQICSWEQLSEADRQYHRNVVKASYAVQQNK